jgi:hypothetical protein
MNWVNGYELGFRSGSRLLGSDSRLMGRIGLCETGACPLGWPGCSATCWAASRAVHEWGWAGPLDFGPVVHGVIKFFFSNLFNIYTLNMIQIQTLNDYSSQNKIQEHFITQENMQRHEMQQIFIYLYK